MAFLSVSSRHLATLLMGGRQQRHAGARGAIVRGLCVLALGLVGLVPTFGCSVSQDGILPPRGRIFLPEGGLVDGRWLYVVNSNSDLRYNDGTMAVVDLELVRKDREEPLAPWPVCPANTRYLPDPTAAHSCCWDFLDRNVLNCDEQDYIKKDATIRIGSFGGKPVVHKTLDGQRRLLVPIRGNSSVTMVHLDDSNPEEPRLVCSGPAPLRCGTPPVAGTSFAECTDEWRINKFLPPSDQLSAQQLQKLDLRLPEEPYGIAVDDEKKLLYVGHLQSGILSLIDLAAAPSPRLITVLYTAVPPTAAGARGITSLTTLPAESSVFVTSRYRPVVASVATVGADKVPACTDEVEAREAPCDTPTEAGDATCNGARDVAVVPRPELLDTGFASASETRAVAFSQDRRYAYILQRTPPAVVTVDRQGRSASGLMVDSPIAVTEVCANPAFMESNDAGDGLMLFVSCFDTGEIYVVNAAESRVRDVIEVGRGPAGILFQQGAPTGGTARDADHGYVLGFGANNISVVDVRVGSPTRHRVIQRIGFPSPTPRPFVP